MKLTIEGSFEEIRQFMGATTLMIDSVQPASSVEGAREDRNNFPSRESALSLEKSLVCPPGLKNLGCVKSVPQRPEISAARQDRKKKEDLLIPKFKFEHALEKTYKKLKFAELDDGRIVLRYMGTFCTTKDNVAKLPLPLPVGYLTHSGLSPNANTAFRLYCEYLASNNKEKGSVKVPDPGPGIKEDRKSEDDPDRAFKPMLNGAFSTRTDYDGALS